MVRSFPLRSVYSLLSVGINLGFEVSFSCFRTGHQRHLRWLAGLEQIVTEPVWRKLFALAYVFTRWRAVVSSRLLANCQIWWLNLKYETSSDCYRRCVCKCCDQQHWTGFAAWVGDRSDWIRWAGQCLTAFDVNLRVKWKWICGEFAFHVLIISHFACRPLSYLYFRHFIWSLSQIMEIMCWVKRSIIAAWVGGRSLWFQRAGEWADWNKCWNSTEIYKKISLWYVGPIYTSYRRFQLTVVFPAFAVAGDDYHRFEQVMIGEDFQTRNASSHRNLRSNNLQCSMIQRKRTAWRVVFTHSATCALRYVFTHVSLE